MYGQRKPRFKLYHVVNSKKLSWGDVIDNIQQRPYVWEKNDYISL